MITIGIDFYKKQEERINPKTGELRTFDLGGFYGEAIINNNEQKLFLPMVSGDTIDEIERRRKVYQVFALSNKKNTVLYDKAISKEGLLRELETFIKRLYGLDED